MMGSIVFILFIKQLYGPLVGHVCLHKQKLEEASAAASPPHRYPADCMHASAQLPPATLRGSAGAPVQRPDSPP